MNDQVPGQAVESASAVQLPALVDWAKAPTLMELKQDLQDAKPIHDAQMAKVREWLDNLNVEGKARPKPRKNSSTIQPKLIRKQAEWRYPALSEPFLSTDDVFNVLPVTWEDRKAARQNELVLNHQLNTRIDKVKFFDEYVRAFVDEGTVIVYLGWCYESREYEEEGPVFEYVVDPTFAPTIQYLDQLKAQDPQQYASEVPAELKEAHSLSQEQGSPVRPEQIGHGPQQKTRIVKNHPKPEVLDLTTVVVDPTCQGDIEAAGFVVRWYESCKADLKKYGDRYKNLDRIQADTNSILGTPDGQIGSRENQSFNFSDDARKKFVVYQYWGKRDVKGDGTLTPFVAEWVGDTFIRMEEAPVPEAGLPFVMEQYLPRRKSNYGEPDGELLVDNQKVMGAITRGMIDLMGRSANGQTGMRKDMLDAVNKRKFENGEDYEFNPNVNPIEGVFMHSYPEIPQSAQFMLQLQAMEAESLTGVKAWSQGIGSNSLGDVAAAVRGALDAASKRELSILRRLANGVIKLGRKMIAFNSELMSDEEVVRITNDVFVPVRRDDLPGNFDLKLSISTAEEDNNKAEQLAFMYQTSAPNGDPGLNRMILADIARLRKMPDLAERIENYQAQPDPLAQKQAELAMAKIEAEIAEIRAKTQKLLVDAGLGQAKSITEGAKAAHLKSVTDQANLDFVEQESGVKQERDLQKQGAQAEAQSKLAVVQHHLDARRDAIGHQADLLKEYLKTRANKPGKN